MSETPAAALPCGLCGYPTFGDFAIRIPGDDHAVMHTMSCGPPLNGVGRISEPTHELAPDGTVRRILS